MWRATITYTGGSVSQHDRRELSDLTDEIEERVRRQSVESIYIERV